MNIQIDDQFHLGDDSYITMDTLEYGGLKYLFVNKLDKSEEPTMEFFVFRCEGNRLIRETNAQLLNDTLLKKFSENMNEKLEMIAANLPQEG